MRMCSHESATRGVHGGGPRPAVTLGVACSNRISGGGAIQGPTWISTERDCGSCCSGELGTARSMQGHGSSLEVAADLTGALLSSCPSQPPQFASAAFSSMLTHPSSSMQTTNPCAGVNPVRSTSARQSHATKRVRRGSITKTGDGTYIGRRTTALEPRDAANIVLRTLARACWSGTGGVHLSPTVVGRFPLRPQPRRRRGRRPVAGRRAGRSSELHPPRAAQPRNSPTARSTSCPASAPWS